MKDETPEDDNILQTDSAHPLVSIVILNFNKAQLTIECLESIYGHTDTAGLEVVVVDNGSSEADFRILSSFEGQHRLIRLRHNRYFGEGNNIGFEATHGDFIVFMNNDIKVTANWLPPLLRVFDERQDCGVAGPKFVYPSAVLQEAGALVDRDGTTFSIGKHLDPTLPLFNRARTVDYVSGATLVIRRSSFQQLLGFDQTYEPAYFEDVDLCLKVRQRLGLVTRYVPEACVIHHENATTADPRNAIGLQGLGAINRRKFIGRWGEYLADPRNLLPPRPTGFSSTPAPPPPSSRAAIAVITSDILLTTSDSCRYLLTMAEYLLASGHRTYIAFDEQYSSLRLTQLAQVFSLNLDGLTPCVLENVTDLGEVAIRVFNTDHPPRESLDTPGSMRLWIPTDAFFNGTEDPTTVSEISEDIPIVFSTQHDMEKFSAARRTGEDRRLACLPSYLPDSAPPPVATSASSTQGSILSVGQFAADHRCQGQHMLISALKALHQSGLSVELHLAGPVTPDEASRKYLYECQDLAHNLPIFFYIDPTPEQLANLYRSNSIYWHGFNPVSLSNPELTYGDRYGFSILSALSHGLQTFVFGHSPTSFLIDHEQDGYLYSSIESLISYTNHAIIASSDTNQQKHKTTCKKLNFFSKSSFMHTWSNILISAQKHGKRSNNAY